MPPLAHPFLEKGAPPATEAKRRSKYFSRQGEWAYALSALQAADDAGPTPEQIGHIERLRASWRISDDEVDAGTVIPGRTLKRALQAARNVSAGQSPDFDRDAWYLREAHRRGPDDPRTRLLLTIALFGTVDGVQSIPYEPAYKDYLTIDDVPELKARLDHLVEKRRHKPYWYIVGPSASGTWQLRDYVRHLESVGRSSCLGDTHKFAFERYHPSPKVVIRRRVFALYYLSRLTNMRFIIAGNLHDPVQALIYGIVRKNWVNHFRRRNVDLLQSADVATADDIETVHEHAQAIMNTARENSLEKYFQANYTAIFGLPFEEFQIRHRQAGYFVGFQRNIVLALTRLNDIDTALPQMVQSVLTIDTSGCRPPADFRTTSPPALSQRLREISARIAIPSGVAERSIENSFMEEHFLPEQLQAMRDRWYK